MHWEIAHPTGRLPETAAFRRGERITASLDRSIASTAMANLDRLSAMANAHQDTHYLLHPPTTVAGAKYHPQERSSSIAQQQRSATPMTNAVREFIMRPRDGYEQASSGAFSRSSSVASLSHLWHGESRHRAPSFSRTLARSHPKVLTLPSFVYTPTCP